VPQRQAIFIDWYGCLSVSRFWEAWADPRHVQHHSFKLIQSLLTSELSEMMENWMRGNVRSEACVHEIAKLTNISSSLALGEFVRSCRGMTMCDPGITATLQNLRSSGYLVFISTDNMDCFNRWVVPSLGLDRSFDGILNSSDMRILKTDGAEAFFGPTMAKYGLRPDACAVIDDSLSIGQSVEQLGCRYIRHPFGGDLIATITQTVLAYQGLVGV
jgi:FMN phosphatase YigB (HAD superfamily)